MESVGQLSGGIAHDFNNLLTVILGNAELLCEALKARPDLRDLGLMIISAADRGAELTRRLLAFSRRQTLQPLAIDCNRLVDRMQHLLRRALREDIDIRISVDPIVKKAFADPGQLESAILNLALNARDAMPNGGCLTITTTNAVLDRPYIDNHPEVSSGEYVLVTVTDNGEGMPLEVLERVFEPFFTTKEVGKGSGLGLSMVYGFAKQSNGHVSLYSELGLGTTVRLYLPSASSVTDKIAVPAKNQKPRQGGSETVLVTEDDPFVRNYAVTCLKSLGYRVIVAADSGEALAQVAREPQLDVLFTDIVMPGNMNGWELAERARQIRPGLKMLLTSGYALDTLVRQGRLQADVRILNKPYRKAELAERLRQTLDAID
jgi:CheY-like chemotaxis protein